MTDATDSQPSPEDIQAALAAWRAGQSGAATPPAKEAAPAASAAGSASTDAPDDTEPDTVEGLKEALKSWKGFARKHETEAKRLLDRAAVADKLETEMASKLTDTQKLANELKEVKDALALKERVAARSSVAASTGVPLELLPDTSDEAALTAYATSLLNFKGQPAADPAKGKTASAEAASKAGRPASDFATAWRQAISGS